MHRWSPFVLPQETTAVMLLVHTVAIILYMAIGVILLRALLLLRRSGERLTGFLAIAALILFTSLCRAAWLILIWCRATPPFWLDPLVLGLVYAGFMTTPVVLSGSYLPIAEREAERPFHLVLHRVMIVNVVAGALFLSMVFTGASKSFVFGGIAFTCALAAILLWVRIVSLRSLQIRRRGLVLFALFTLAGLLTVCMVLIYGATHNVLVRRSTLTATALEFSSLLIVLGMLFVFANLRLADIIVKRVLRLTLWICAALGVWIGTIVIGRSLRFLSGVRAEAFRDLLAIALIAAFGAASPWGLRLLDLWIDRWVFEQPNFDAAIKMLWDRLIRSESPSAVFEEAEQTIRQALSLADVEVIAREGAMSDTAPAEAGRPGAHFRYPFSTSGQPGAIAGEVLVPLFVEGSANHWVAVNRGAMRPPLTAMELAFVDRVVSQVQVRLETMLAEQRRMEELRREATFREELADAELRALRAQINPHFLFNSLNTIADLTVTAPVRAEKMILQLSAVFRYVLINTERQFATLREEINFARSYLEIEEFRFGDRLRTRFEIDPEVLEESVPTLLLQPLIENALKHGLAPRRGGGTIYVIARRDSSGVTLIIADDGVGLRSQSNSSRAAGTNVGLSNVSRRLATAYQGHATFQLNPRKGGGTEAIVMIEKGWQAV